MKILYFLFILYINNQEVNGDGIALNPNTLDNFDQVEDQSLDSNSMELIDREPNLKKTSQEKSQIIP